MRQDAATGGVPLPLAAAPAPACQNLPPPQPSQVHRQLTTGGPREPTVSRARPPSQGPCRKATSNKRQDHAPAGGWQEGVPRTRAIAAIAATIPERTRRQMEGGEGESPGDGSVGGGARGQRGIKLEREGRPRRKTMGAAWRKERESERERSSVTRASGGSLVK